MGGVGGGAGYNDPLAAAAMTNGSNSDPVVRLLCSPPPGADVMAELLALENEGYDLNGGMVIRVDSCSDSSSAFVATLFSPPPSFGCVCVWLQL